MARSRKKTVSQKVVGVATTGLPSPVRKVLGGRFVAMIIVVTIPILFATGVVSVRWEDGRPKVSFNQKRASQVRESVRQEVDQLADEYGRDGQPNQQLLPSFGQPRSGPQAPNGSFRPLSSFNEKLDSQRR